MGKWGTKTKDKDKRWESVIAMSGHGSCKSPIRSDPGTHVIAHFRDGLCPAIPSHHLRRHPSKFIIQL